MRVLFLCLFPLTTPTIPGYAYPQSLTAIPTPASSPPSLRPTRTALHETPTSDDGGGGGRLDAYLRFSPLVGGPPFLPVHVEVLLHRSTERREREREYEREYLHRLDFLPENPTDPATLTRLLTMRSVPAVVRRRTLLLRPEGANSEEEEGAGDGEVIRVSEDRIRSLLGKRSPRNPSNAGSFVVPLGPLPPFTDGEETTAANAGVPELPPSVETFVRDGRRSGVGLHLVTNNCYAFAVGVIRAADLGMF